MEGDNDVERDNVSKREIAITEEVTGVDIVRSQILIAKGHKLADPEIFIKDQASVECNGFAIQCRVTTENPKEGLKKKTYIVCFSMFLMLL